MFRNKKILGFTLMAMMGFSAIAAQGTIAKPLTVPAGLTKVYVTGEKESETIFSTPNGTIKCSTDHFHGSGSAASGSVNELTVETTYSVCTAFGFATAHVKMNGCVDTFTTPTSISPGVVTWGPSQYHIVCPAEKRIEITPTTFGVSACTQFIASQTPTSGHMVGRNGTTVSPMDVTLEDTFEGIHYTGTGGVCGNSETHSDGKSTVNITMTCFADQPKTAPVDCTFS